MKKADLLPVLFILIFNFISIQAQSKIPSDSTNSFFPGVYNDIQIGLSDGGRLISAPFSFTGKDWLITSGIIGGTALAFLADKSIRSDVQKHQSKGLDNFAKPGSYYGNLIYPGILSGIVYLGGKVLNNRDISSTGRMMIESLVYSGIITTVLKVSLGRSRPYMNQGSTHFLGFKLNNDYLSFPSGHVTVAFAVSSVLAAKIDNVYASIFLYGLAGVTAFQRIYSDEHWFSDTVFAAAVSTVVGRAIVNYDEERNNKDNNGSLSFYPVFQSNGLGIGAVLNF